MRSDDLAPPAASAQSIDQRFGTFAAGKEKRQGAGSDSAGRKGVLRGGRFAMVNVALVVAWLAFAVLIGRRYDRLAAAAA